MLRHYETLLYGVVSNPVQRLSELPTSPLELVVRIDEQVKVRGFRVKPEEIERVLNSHSAVQETAVHAVGEHLIAYVVGASGASLETSELRGYLRERLPGYMIPSAFIVLEALPLTLNGNIDYRALPAPDQRQFGRNGSFEAPRTPTEEILAGIWAEVLKLNRVGTRDNFFDLGGHSLLATRVVSRIRDTFQITLPVRTVFQAADVVELAEILTRHETSPGQVATVARLYKQINEMSADEIRMTLQNRKKGA
jgi:acyl carrier protein